jgi:sigma-B regulation protein RsbU (phosphoserine phosphatase)
MTADKIPASQEIEILQSRLAQREAELQIINSVQLGLLERLDVQSIFNLVGDKIRDIFQAQVVMISMYDKQTETIEHRYAFERGERIIAPGHFPIRGFRIWVVETHQPVLVNENVAELAAQLGQPTLPGTITPKTWLGVPMIVNEQVTGILSLQDVDKEHAFDEPVVRLLQTLAASMSVALENARLWEQENLYRRSLEREFEIGREIQAGFLPEVIPQPPGWEIAAALKSAREVAGDFFDVFELSESRIGLIIADVCDKGLGAALFMTLFRSLLRAVSNIDFYARVEAGGANSSATRLRNAISLTNNYIAETHSQTGMFATVFFGILDTRSGSLIYLNCGHLSPVVVGGRRLKQVLEYSGPALGVTTDALFDLKETGLEPGDLLFAYTDGLIDSENPGQKPVTMDSLIHELLPDLPLAGLLEKLVQQADQRSLGEKPYDDITLLAVKRETIQGKVEVTRYKKVTFD